MFGRSKYNKFVEYSLKATNEDDAMKMKEILVKLCEMKMVTKN